MAEHFAALYSYGPAEEQARHRPEHRAFLARLLEEGRLLVSGPFADDGAPGALLVLRAESAQAVKELLREDPMQVHGVVTGTEIRAWNPVLGTVG